MKQKFGFFEQLFHLPLFLLFFGLASVLMLIPASYAGVLRELETGRAFLYSGLLGIIIFVLISMAHHDPCGSFL
jgi:trk system potassium uptake protein TrkH